VISGHSTQASISKHAAHPQEDLQTYTSLSDREDGVGEKIAKCSKVIGKLLIMQ